MTWINFQTVRENLDVSEVLSHYGFDVKLNGQDQVKICSPFHGDHKPSCGLNLTKGVFNCFPVRPKATFWISSRVHDEEGDLIAYAGRLASEQQDDDKPRYLLPKGFEKSCVLYNLNRVIAKREQMIEEGEDVDDAVVVVEGYWSVLRLHAVSVPVVASFGASLSPQQVSLLVQAGFRKAVLIFDGDEGGRKGSEQALPVLATRLFAKTVSLEDGVKPDEMSDKIVAELPRYVR